MPALVIGALTVPNVMVASRADVEAVDRERTLDNSMLATLLAPMKRSWNISVNFNTQAELNALETALNTTPPVVCSGDLLGGTYNCHVERSGGDIPLGYNPMRKHYTFTLHEV